jgi:hypothetical protein
MILSHLQKGMAITPLEALAEYGCFRLAARIAELKSLGHNITTNIVDFKGKKVAEYRLISNFVK